jgi:hypothetical protein
MCFIAALITTMACSTQNWPNSFIGKKAEGGRMSTLIVFKSPGLLDTIFAGAGR